MKKHIATPLTASEIRKALRITKKELDDARRAIRKSENKGE
jgi:hypothetical protein